MVIKTSTVAKYLTYMKKTPRQNRSAALVDSVFEAATHILEDSNGRDFDMPALFKKAGVGAGSFYQYFYGRRSFIKAYCQRLAEKKAEEFLNKCWRLRQEGVTPQDILDTMVDTIVLDLIGPKSKVRFAYPFVLKMGLQHEMLKIREIFHKAMIEEAKFYVRSDVSDHELQHITYVFIHAFMGVIWVYANGLQSNTQVEELQIQLKNLARAYLSPCLKNEFSEVLHRRTEQIAAV